MRKLIWTLFLIAGLVVNAYDSAMAFAKSRLVPRLERARDNERSDLLFFSERSGQADEFDALLAAHRSHRSHSSHRSHYSGRNSYGHSSHTSHYSSRYSSPAPSTYSRTPAVPRATAVPKPSGPQVFRNWSTTNFDPATSQDACANSGSFAWCVSKDKSRTMDKAAGVSHVGSVSLYALLKVAFPKKSVKISRQTPMWYSIDGKKPVSCTITDVTEKGNETEVNFAPENIAAFDTGCKKGRQVSFTVREGGKEQTETFSLSGFTQAQSKMIKELEESLRMARE